MIFDALKKVRMTKGQQTEERHKQLQFLSIIRNKTIKFGYIKIHLAIKCIIRNYIKTWSLNMPFLVNATEIKYI